MEIDVDPKKHGVGKTVLVVDDNAAIRKMIAAAYLSDGLKTCGEAENSKEGVELAKKIHPDIIALDLSMPVMNAMEAASEYERSAQKRRSFCSLCTETVWLKLKSRKQTST